MAAEAEKRPPSPRRAVLVRHRCGRDHHRREHPGQFAHQPVREKKHERTVALASSGSTKSAAGRPPTLQAAANSSGSPAG
jgi:hypothetical protein